MAREGWFYTRRGQEVGPLTWGELKAAAATGRLGPTDRVWAGSNGRRRCAADVPGLIDGDERELAAAPPAVARPPAPAGGPEPQPRPVAPLAAPPATAPAAGPDNPPQPAPPRWPGTDFYPMVGGVALAIMALLVRLHQWGFEAGSGGPETALFTSSVWDSVGLLFILLMLSPVLGWPIRCVTRVFGWDREIYAARIVIGTWLLAATCGLVLVYVGHHRQVRGRLQYEGNVELGQADAALNANPTAEGYVRRAHARVKLGLLDAALDDANRALELRPDLPPAYLTRAYVYELKGEAGRAKEDRGVADALKRAAGAAPR